MEKWDKLSMKDRSKYIQLAVESGINNLDNIRDTYNKFADGGYIDDYTVTSVSPPENNKYLDGGTILRAFTQPLIKTIYDVGKSFVTAVNPENKMPIYQDLKGKEMKDVSKTNKANFVIGNEFSEKNRNTVRKAKNFKHTTDTLLGDRKIPLSKISQFYGMENGKLKVGDLDTFDDNTEVVPVRNKNVGKIKEVGIKKTMIPDYSDLVNKKYPVPSFWRSLTHPDEAHQNRINRINYSNELARKKAKTNKYIKVPPRTYFINENNDTIYPSGQFGIHDKMLFSDEEGNAIFLKDIEDEKVFNQLNKALKEKSRYPILIDNGRYSHYEPTGDVNSYPIQGFDTKKDMYLIGY